jgi:hypothetical protein
MATKSIFRLVKSVDNVMNGKVINFLVDYDDVLWLKSQLLVPNVVVTYFVSKCLVCYKVMADH